MDDFGMDLDDIDFNEFVGELEQDGVLEAVVDKITENVSISIRICFSIFLELSRLSFLLLTSVA